MSKRAKFRVVESDRAQRDYPSIRTADGTLVAVFYGFDPHQKRDVIKAAVALGRANYCAEALNRNEKGERG